MANGRRTHPTQSLGVRNEINQVHAFGKNGNETSGWPFRPNSVIGYPVGPRVFRNPRASQDELGGKSRPRSRRRRKR